MKKSVVLTIGVIYVLAIVVVGFIGMKMKVYNQHIYVESITCISEGYKEYDQSHPEKKNGIDGYIKVDYEEGSAVLLKCVIHPENATDQDLEYNYDSSSTIFVVEKQSDGTAYVRFLKPGTARITIKSTDGTNKTLVIKIIAIELSDII